MSKPSPLFDHLSYAKDYLAAFISGKEFSDPELAKLLEDPTVEHHYTYKPYVQVDPSPFSWKPQVRGES